MTDTLPDHVSPSCTTVSIIHNPKKSYSQIDSNISLLPPWPLTPSIVYSISSQLKYKQKYLNTEIIPINKIYLIIYLYLMYLYLSLEHLNYILVIFEFWESIKNRIENGKKKSTEIEIEIKIEISESIEDPKLYN